MNNKHHSLHLAFRTWYGTITFLRAVTKVIAWGITGFFWVLTILPMQQTLQWFSYVTTYLLIYESMFMFINVVWQFVANFVPSDAPKFRTQGNALVRYDFWELLVRVSNAKYRETGICKSYHEALEKMIKENIFTHQHDPW